MCSQPARNLRQRVNVLSLQQVLLFTIGAVVVLYRTEGVYVRSAPRVGWIHLRHK